MKSDEEIMVEAGPMHVATTGHRAKRLWQWVTREKCLPIVTEAGYTNELRPPTLREAITGISDT
jgi:hypothetical protein